MPSVLITGGGTGIGAAVARHMAEAGYGVCIMGRRRQPLAHMAAEIDALAVTADTAQPEAVDHAVRECAEHFGRLDALVVGAGTGASGAVGEQSLERWQTVLETNLTGAFLVCQAALPHLLETRGALVTVSSLAGLRAGPRSAAYCASKGGLIMLTQSMAVDYGPRGVRANCICPGWIRTPMADGEMDELAKASRASDREAAYTLATANVPARRPGSPAEVAQTIAWLLSPAASYVNGAVITVDGGASIVDAGTLVFGSRA